MRIGVPKEIKTHEYRVALTPSGVKELRREGHEIIIENGAGEGSGFSDKDYSDTGARLSDKANLFKDAELIIKVKEPLHEEYELLQDSQALFTFLHLAPNPELTEILLKKNIAGFAYETLEEHGVLPLLQPMSEIAGRMAPLMGAFYLQKVYGGNGILSTGVEGVLPARVLILGAGVVGMNAARIALGMGARVTVINRGIDKLQKIDELFNGRADTLPATLENIKNEALKADIVIGAVLVTGAKTPKLISRELVSKMKKGSVIVDVSVDQGGCIETTRPTTHDNPIYEVDGVIHYTVANMPGAYSRTSTIALTNRTLAYIKLLVRDGIEKSAGEGSPLRSALNTYKGKIMLKAIEAAAIHGKAS